MSTQSQYTAEIQVNHCTLRAITEDDMSFLRKVYATTRVAELTLTNWNDQQKEEFIDMQFHAQHLHYQKYYGDADYSIIQMNGKDIGRLYVLRNLDELNLMEVTLLPEYRNMGIGTYFLRQLENEADKKNLPIRLHVEPNNPAKRMYLRSGFSVIGKQEFYEHMERKPKKK